MIVNKNKLVAKERVSALHFYINEEITIERPWGMFLYAYDQGIVMLNSGRY